MTAPKECPDELKARAVRLYLESDPKPTIRKLAQQLGVHHEALRNWIRQADTGQRPEPEAPDLTEENKRLRKQVAELERSTTSCVLRVRISPRRSARPGGDRAVRQGQPAPGRARIAGARDRLVDLLLVVQNAWNSPRLGQIADQALPAEIVDIHTSSGGTHGSARVHAMLARRGISVGRKRVERVLRGAGLQGAFLRKRWRIASTRTDPRAAPARIWSNGLHCG
ncbi:transposase [Nocardia farcinica]|uniref:transposase n=1 Tax=Nocardia farcinica TaxID=37329 RepID=UPI001894989E|nr:transposase [Nocardia farcinica]MBF6271632.1 transposase [Nocardia farcinica]MCZ9330419.1 transposase [Nocardia farcinica]